MHLLDDHVIIAPEDLAECEFALVRRVGELRDMLPPTPAGGFLTERTAALARDHRQRVVGEYRRRYGLFTELSMGPSVSLAEMRSHHEASVAELRSLRALAGGMFLYDGGPGVVLAAAPAVALPTAVAGTVADRFTRPADLAGLGATALAVNEATGGGITQVFAHLNNDRRRELEAADLLPVARARITRLAGLLGRANAVAEPWPWGDDAVVACGFCPWCRAAAALARDVQVVWGTRRALRGTLRRAGLPTIDALAESEEAPAGVDRLTWATFRDRARLQLDEERTGVRTASVHNRAALAALPEPDAGDLFFDFEGDPLWVEKNRFEWGLEFLFGYVAADTGQYTGLWSGDQKQEGRAFARFVDFLLARREQFPGMHVYHFAFYEPARMRSLARRHRFKQTEIAELLDSGLFVDLYQAVKAAVNSSGTSYGLKALEPLYLSTARAAEVGDGAAAVDAFAEYRRLHRAGESAAAERLRAEITSYNEEDCRSTQQLRDWLLSLRPAPATAIDVARNLLGASELTGELLLAPLAEDPDALDHVRLQPPGFDAPGVFYIASGNSTDALGTEHKVHELLGRWGSGSRFFPGQEVLVAYADPRAPLTLLPRRAILTEVALAGDHTRVVLRETTPAHDPASTALTPLFLQAQVPHPDPKALIRSAKRRRYTLITGAGEAPSAEGGSAVVSNAHHLSLRQALVEIGEAGDVVVFADPALAPPPPRRTHPADLIDAPLLTFLTGDFGAKVETHAGPERVRATELEYHPVSHHGRRGVSPEEAGAVVDIVRGLLAADLAEGEILVTAPDDGQVLLLARELARWPQVRVARLTEVGEPGAVAILSLGLSTLADLPDRSAHTPLAPHVLAAARTYGRQRAILVHSAQLLEQLPPRADMFGEVAAFAARS